MASISNYISSHLLAPLKQYPTLIQDTMIEIITEKFERLYEYTQKFPSIVSPNQTRLDILQAIADQFLFTVREDADLQEQINILDNILYVYSKRGSIDTIENMWKYYGGNLPKDVKVVIPSYNIFRYNISALSGTHTYLKGKDSHIKVDPVVPTDIESGALVRILDKSRSIVITSRVLSNSNTINLANTAGLNVGDKIIINLPDMSYEGTIIEVSDSSKEAMYNSVNTPGVYEVRLYNNTYPIPELKEFLLKELVAAGNEIYFTNALYMQSLGDDITSVNPYTYNIYSDNLVQIQLESMKTITGLRLSGSDNHLLSLYDDDNPPSILNSLSDSAWSGSGALFIELTHMLHMSVLDLSYMTSEGVGLGVSKIYHLGSSLEYYDQGKSATYTRSSLDIGLTTKYQVDSGVEILSDFIGTSFPEYFILGDTLLGVNYST